MFAYFFRSTYNTIKDPHWYNVQEGDATMIHNASSPGQKILSH